MTVMDVVIIAVTSWVVLFFILFFLEVPVVTSFFAGLAVGVITFLWLRYVIEGKEAKEKNKRS